MCACYWGVCDGLGTGQGGSAAKLSRGPAGFPDGIHGLKGVYYFLGRAGYVSRRAFSPFPTAVEEDIVGAELWDELLQVVVDLQPEMGVVTAQARRASRLSPAAVPEVGHHTPLVLCRLRDVEPGEVVPVEGYGRLGPLGEDGWVWGRPSEWRCQEGEESKEGRGTRSNRKEISADWREKPSVGGGLRGMRGTSPLCS